MNGFNGGNSLGHYSVMGVPSSINSPPNLYETCEWTDQQGNFWIYGGIAADSAGNGSAPTALWKFDPMSNEWTWMKGSGIISRPDTFHYGTRGIADVVNSPGPRVFGACTWVDMNNNLWLYGGVGNYYDSLGNHHGGELADLWKYDISINQWTWVSGTPEDSLSANCYCQSATLNLPGSREEFNTSWVDNQNNLWLFGGRGNGSFGNDGDMSDMWKYDISQDTWTLINGSISINQPSVYGVLGVSDPLNNPGGRWSYCKWKDLQGNFWLFGGLSAKGNTVYLPFDDVWKYDVTSNEWAWMSGSQGVGQSVTYGTQCVKSPVITPGMRWKNRSCWVDGCGKFWTYGGMAQYFSKYSDLWRYDPLDNQWTNVSGSTFNNQQPGWGVRLVSTQFNRPGGRFGGVGFIDKRGYFWLFGGWGTDQYNDTWRYVPDNSCSGCMIECHVSTTESQICPGTCTDFTNISLNAISYQWSFPGASPDTSTDINPQNICYANPGSYDVQLIATNANGSDTLLLTNYITVYPTPAPQGISQNGDTLFAIAGAASYQWYFNGNIISGATDYFYVAQASGDYNVVATDINGCEVDAAISNVVAGQLSTVDSRQLTIFPNPVEDKFTMYYAHCTMGTAVEISIYDVLGEIVYRDVNCRQRTVDCRLFQTGLYWLEITSSGKIFRTKFIKQ